MKNRKMAVEGNCIQMMRKDGTVRIFATEEEYVAYLKRLLEEGDDD